MIFSNYITPQFYCQAIFMTYSMFILPYNVVTIITEVIKMYVDYKDLGKRIAKRRRELGLKQYQVSEKAGLSDKYISCIETAKSIPSIDVLVRICDALETTPDSLLLGAVNDTSGETYERQLIAKLAGLDDKARRLAIEMLDRFVQYEMDRNR